MNWQRLLRNLMKWSNDAKAVRKGRVGNRIKRRVWGKLTGRVARRWDK